MNLMKKFLVLFLVLVICPSVFAQQNITLDDAVRTAISNNLDISSIQNNMVIQNYYLRRSQGALFPSLNLNGRWTRNITDSKGGTIFQNGVPITIPDQSTSSNDFNLSLNSTVTLFDGFANFRQVDYDETAINTYRIEIERQKTDVVINVNTLYIEVLKNEQIVIANQRTLADSKAQLERIREIINVGRGTIGDLYKQDVQVATDELNLQRSQNVLEKSKVDLLNAMNDDVNKPVTASAQGINVNITNEELAGIVAANSNVDALVRKGIADRYDFKSVMLQIELNRINLDIAEKKEYFPVLSAFGNYNLNGDAIGDITNTRVATFGLQLSYPIFQGFSYDVNRQVAEVNIRQSEIDLQKLERAIKAEIKRAVLDLQNSYNQVVVIDRSIRSAEQDKLLSEENYRLGLGTLLDVQIATTRLNNLQIEKINATYNFLIAKRLIDYYSGQIKY
jgi:outer membrane protein